MEEIQRKQLDLVSTVLHMHIVLVVVIVVVTLCSLIHEARPVQCIVELCRYGCLGTIRMCEDWLAVNLLSHLPDHPARCCIN